ncbi:MAG: phage tail sheath subtilisin-like domain-containing protein [Defluviitaleaceae bacterium]|nr:phage tail sheath subtilisin-like domain-containing protein [Defluviitaleaceae bacterium]
MAEYLSPGVYVEEFDSGMMPMDGVGTSTAGFIGMAERGSVIGTPLSVSSYADYCRNYGGYLSAKTHGENCYLPYEVEKFFANGGTRCYIMRVAPQDAKPARTANNSKVWFEAANPGAWGNGIKFVLTERDNPKTKAKVDDAKTFTLSNTDGFEEGDIVAISQNGGKATYGRIESMSGKTITLGTDVGIAKSYEPAKPPEVKPGDAKDVKPEPPKPVDAHKFSGEVTILCCKLDLMITCGIMGPEETYEDISLNDKSSDFIGNALAKSRLVKVHCSGQLVKDGANPMEAFPEKDNDDDERYILAFTGGSDGNCKKLDESLYLGGGIEPGKRTGLEAFIEISDVSIMAIPGITSPVVQSALVAQCERLEDRFAILDMPCETVNPGELLKHRETVDSSYCAMYHPWIESYDPLSKKTRCFPPSGFMAGIYARSDASRGVHKAPANEVVNHANGLYCLYNKGDQDQLNPKGVNLIRALPGQGIRVWGGRTCSSNALWKYVNVRRLFIYLEETIKASTNWVVFEPNDEVLWDRVRLTITAFLRDMYRDGALVGSSEDQAFFVNIGPDTMSQQDILNGRLICVIGVAPSRPAEFVIFRITQKTGE